MPTRSTFTIPGMDCPSEERLIRMALDPIPGIESLSFDLQGRRLVVEHGGEPAPLLAALEPLGFGASLAESVAAPTSAPGEGAPGPADPAPADPAAERRVLHQLLAINAAMFVIEGVLGLVAESAGLLADSLDMLADAGVYGVSLFVVGRGLAAQRRAARVSGQVMAILALGVLVEVVRRAVFGAEPVEGLMIGVGALALAANVACVALLARHRHGGLHLRASWIFSTNDALANLGVIVAGLLVRATGSPIPDLVVGTAVGLLVLVGAVRILRLGRGGPEVNPPA